MAEYDANFNLNNQDAINTNFDINSQEQVNSDFVINNNGAINTDFSTNSQSPVTAEMELAQSNQFQANLIINMTPTETSQLFNNGEDGSSPYATQQYVNEHSGECAIEHIEKNGVELEIINKTVNITVPVNTSDLTNNSDFQTSTDVSTSISTHNSDTLAHPSILGAISDINGLIPLQASSSNQLADKNFVNSSIATNTAYFIGTFNSVAELEAYSGDLSNNDYAFVISTDAQGNTVYNRYKYNADTEEWLFEYSLNNSSFTASQWAAINSGATDVLINSIPNKLENTAQNKNSSLTILGNSTNKNYNINIGHSSSCLGQYSIALGYGSNSGTGNNNVAIGGGATCGGGDNCVAIGYNAKAQATRSIQIGTGTNTNANTVNFYTWSVFDYNTGLFKWDRLPKATTSNTGAVKPDNDTININNNGVISATKYTAGEGIAINGYTISATGGGGGAAKVPRLADVFPKQNNREQGTDENYAPSKEWKNNYETLLFTTNLTKSEIKKLKDELYVSVLRFKRNKGNHVDGYSFDYVRDRAKFVVQNDRRKRTNLKLYCWKFDLENGYNDNNPQRYNYFYVRSEYDTAQDLYDDDPQIGIWGDASDLQSCYATCINAVAWNSDMYVSDMLDYDVDLLSRAPEYDVYTIDGQVSADYRAICKVFQDDNGKFYAWCINWDNDEDVYVYKENYEIVYDFIELDPSKLTVYDSADPFLDEFEEIETRLDLNCYIFPDWTVKDNIINSIEYFTFRTQYVGSCHNHWSCYWFDYPITPTLLSKCEVMIIDSQDYTNYGRYIELDKISDEVWDRLPDNVIFKMPWDTYYLWMRFMSWQKRCTYGYNSETGEDEPAAANPANKNSYKYASGSIDGLPNNYAWTRRAFARQRGDYKNAVNTQSGKITEYIQFNLLNVDNVIKGSVSRSIPIQKRLVHVQQQGSGICD